MEQKFTFKRMLSLLVVFTMLFASFAVLAVAEDAPVIGLDRVNHYDWTAKQYNSADYADTAASAGEVLVSASTDSTKSVYAAFGGAYFDWWYKILAEYDAESGAFVIANLDAPGAENYESWTLGEGKLFITCNTGYASTDAAGNKADADVIKTLAVGDKLYLSTDLASLQAASGALTDVYVQVNEPIASTEPEPIDGIVVDGDLSDWEDNWTLVNNETGYWQTVPTDENELAGSYNFQITSDEENLYVAAEISGLTCTAFRVWFRTNPEATVYTHFYHIDATGAAGKYNTSTTANSGAAIEASEAVGVFAAGETSTIVEFSVPLAEIGATSGDVEYYANTQNGSTLFYPPVAEGATRTENLPYSKWYVEPAEEPDVLPEGAIVLDYAGYIHDSYFMIVAGDNKTVAELTALGHGEAKDMNYCVVAVVGADNVITEMHTTLGRPDGVKSDVVCPEGGYLIVLNANKAGYEALLDAEVGDSIELYNVDVDSIRGAEGNTALENAGFVIVPAEEPEVENLKVEVNVNDRAVLTDGEIDVTDSWFNGASGKAVLINNNACTTKAMDVTVLYALDGTKKIDSLALTFFHEGVTMIGYPEGQVLVEVSTDGETYTEVGKFDLAESGLSKETYGTVTNVFEFDAVEAAYVKATFTVGSSTDVLGPEPDQGKVFWEFVALTEVAVTEYVPVTSKVVTDWNPAKWGESYGQEYGAYIYTDADIYASADIAWWVHAAFVPSETVEGYYEVVALKGSNTGEFLTFPEGGFIWAAWGSAGDSADSAGAYTLSMISSLGVGDIVDFVGVDVENKSTETDAYVEIWVDPNAPENIAKDKDYTLSGEVNATYNADLTDGLAAPQMTYGGEWFAFTAANTDADGIGYVIIDLAGEYDITGVKVNLVNDTGAAVMQPEFVKLYVSDDGEIWGDAIGTFETSSAEWNAYWAELNELTANGKFVKIEIKRGGTFAFLNEIEVYGEAAPVVEEITLVEGDNDITVPALGSSVATTNFDKDYVITIAGNWNVTVLVNGIEYYPNRMGDLEAPLPAGENTVEFKNSAEEAAEIVATVAAPVVGDTMDDPIVLEEDGDYVADVTEKYPEGVYYQYTATEDGTVTITITTETGWTYVINNITAGKYGDTHWSDDETVVATETIEVKAGDVIQFLVATYDADNPWSAPVGTVNFTLDVPGTTVEPVLPPEDAKFSGQILTNGGFAEKDVTIFVRLGELDTIAEVAAALRGLDLTDPAQAEKADYNYYYLVLVGADGIVTEVNYNLGRETGDKSNVVIPEGGYALLAHGVGEAAEALKGIEVGQKIVLTNVDLAALAEATEASELTDAYYSVYDVAPETVEIALGDINMDGKVNQYDYILAKRAHFNNITLTESQAKVGDMDADGDNDQYDYILIKRIHFDNYSTDAKVEVPVADVPVTDAEA